MTENYALEIDEFIRRKRYRQINRVLVWQTEPSSTEDGHILADCCYNGFAPSDRNVIKSVAKSIMSACVGIALDKGDLKSLDEPISRFLPEFNESRDLRHRLITVKHLLTMTSGIFWNGGVHYHCPMMDQMRHSGNWISHIADCAVTDMPGTKYNYKEWDVLLLAKILDCVCGDMYDYLIDNLYKPLGIASASCHDSRCVSSCDSQHDVKYDRWYKSPCGVYYSVAMGDGGPEENRSSLTAYDMLKIGQLFLQNGIYHGQQILFGSYCRQATIPSKCNPGYGFLWWVGEDWYGCRGYGGQSITVLPRKRAVIVTQDTP
ncbi:MAG: beta-lactamase family protein, partial [Acetatifactor sp.]|nr:beta-lactamase family protein [Acetatifactor sp.]